MDKAESLTDLSFGCVWGVRREITNRCVLRSLREAGVRQTGAAGKEEVEADGLSVQGGQAGCRGGVGGTPPGLRRVGDKIQT